jgi:hypothetical protein
MLSYVYEIGFDKPAGASTAIGYEYARPPDQCRA